jgi:hypothetical protein
VVSAPGGRIENMLFSDIDLIFCYRGGGETDWYLPSKDEVNTLFRKRAAVGGIPAKSLWSSSQSSHVATYAFGQLLVSEGRYIGSYKGYDGMVRPIRAF